MALTRLGLNQAINLSTNTTGTLGVANGGTGLASGTSGQFLKFTGSTTLASAADNGKTLQVVSATAQNSSNTTSTSFVDTGTTLDITAPTVQLNSSTLVDVNGRMDISGDITSSGIFS